MTTREVIESYFRALIQKTGWEFLLADDMVFTSFTSPVKRVPGKAAFLEATRRFYSTISRVDVTALLVDGANACAFTSYELRPPGGTPFTSDVAERFEVRDGRIVSFGIYFDSVPFPK